MINLDHNLSDLSKKLDDLDHDLSDLPKVLDDLYHDLSDLPEVCTPQKTPDFSCVPPPPDALEKIGSE